METTIETAKIQNKLRPKHKQIPEETIEGSFQKLEKKFFNCIIVESEKNTNIREIMDKCLNFIHLPVEIPNQLEKENIEREQNFSHLLDICCREKIGIINRDYLHEISEKHKREAQNKKISLLKRNFQEITKYLYLNHESDLFENSTFKKLQLNFNELKIDFQIFVKEISEILNCEDENCLDLKEEKKAKNLAEYFKNLCLNLYKQIE